MQQSVEIYDSSVSTRVIIAQREIDTGFVAGYVEEGSGLSYTMLSRRRGGRVVEGGSLY